MKKFLVLAASGLIGIALMAAPAVVLGEDGACVSKQSTGLVKSACERGGQDAAKKAMKGWVKKVKKAKKAAGETEFKINCKTCHAKMKPDYPIKDTAIETFKRHDAWLKSQGSLAPSDAAHVATVLGR